MCRRVMKINYILFILIFFQLFHATDVKKIEKIDKRMKIKNEILNKNLLNSTFQKHPEYIQLKNNLKLELKNLRNSHFKNDSLYKNEVKLIKAKNDSLILNLFKYLIKK